MIVAIDGPAGSGKSTVARALARREGLTYLDTGAMYRAVTIAALERGVDVADAEALGRLARALDIRLQCDETGTRVLVDGEDRTSQIREPRVDQNVSAVAAVPAVRERLVELQRRHALGADVVAEGRDIGTVVFPAAEVKVFLTADPSERAGRRVAQRGERVTDEARERVRRDLVARDEADAGREASPLRAANDAVRIDSTSLTVDDVCDRIVELMRQVRS